MKHLGYIVLLLLTLFPANRSGAAARCSTRQPRASAVWAQPNPVVIGGAATVTTNDSVYGSRVGEHWETYINKRQKSYGAWNPSTGRMAINRLSGADYTHISKHRNTITVSDAFPGLDFSVTLKHSGFEESGVITSASAMTFSILRATNLPNVHTSGDTIFYTADESVFITPLIAVDAAGDTLDVTQTITSLGEQTANGVTLPTWRVTYAIETAGVTYPVTFDPNVVISMPSGKGGRLQSNGTSYLAARDTTREIYTDPLPGLGQAREGSYSVIRSCVGWSVATAPSPDGFKYDSVTIDLYGIADGSATDFNYFAVSGYFPMTLDTANFHKFDGHGASGTYSGVSLTDTLNSANYIAGYGNKFHLTAAGLDSLKARVTDGDTFRLMLLSAEDYDNSTPTGNEMIYFDDAAANAPKLTIYYHYPDGIDSARALDSTRVDVQYDTSNVVSMLGGAIDTFQVVVYNGTDTISFGGYTNQLRDTVTAPYADSSYTIYAKFSKAGGGHIYGRNTGTVRTRAAPTHTLGGGWTQSSIFVRALQGSNRPNTHMAIRIGVPNLVGPRWITTAGDTASLADTAWAKVSEWLAVDSVFSKPYFTTICTLRTVHKNGDSLVTALSAATIDSLFGTVSVAAGFLDSTRVTGSMSVSAYPRWVTTLPAWLSASSTTADSAVSDTVRFTKGTTHIDTARATSVRPITPNSMIALVGVVQLNGRDSLAVSAADTIWTDPEHDGVTFTWKVTSDTSMVITKNIGPANPAHQLFYLIDSSLVAAGSTYVYYGIGQLSTTPVYFDTTYNDTIYWQRNTGVTHGDSIAPRLRLVSGDSTARGL